MTIEERWADVSGRYLAQEGEPPAEEMPTLTEYALMLLIAALYMHLYVKYGPEFCGPVGSEPRDTWDAGGDFLAGFRAMWNL